MSNKIFPTDTVVKATLVAGDQFLIADSADTNKVKDITGTILKTFIQLGDFTLDEGDLQATSATHAKVSAIGDTTAQLCLGKSTNDDIGRIIYRHADDSMAFDCNDSEVLRMTTAGIVFGNVTSNIDCGTITMIKGSQTGDPQVQMALSADANGDFSITADTGDINLMPVAGGGVGIGTTNLPTIETNHKTLRVGRGGAITGRATSNQTFFSNNAYVTGSDYNVCDYINTDEACGYAQNSDGSHRFFSAVSGTADTVITWRNVLQMGLTETVFNEDSYDIDFRIEAVGQANALFVQGSNGYVGFGTGTPAYDLIIEKASVGNVTSCIRNTSTGGAVLFINAQGTTLDAGILFRTGNTVTDWKIGIDNSDSDKFKISNASVLETSTAITIDTNGKVGIGTDSPNSQLEINDGTNNVQISGNQIKFSRAGDSYFDHTGSSGHFLFRMTGSNTTVFEINAGAYCSSRNLYPLADDTYYLGKNDDDTPFAWKGVILKDTTDGKYYRVEVISGTVTATDLTD